MSVVVGKSYYDGSGGKSEGRLVLAGYSASPECWAEVEEAWPGILSSDGHPPCAYLHMSELTARKKIFAGWSDAEEWALLRNAMNKLMAIAWKHRGRFYGAACIVVLDDYNRFCRDFPAIRLKAPHELCVEWVVPDAFHLIQPHPDDPTKPYGYLELVFDQNEGFYHHVYKLWKRPIHKRPLRLQRVSSLITADMKVTPALQVTDFLAWLTNRNERYGALIHQAMRVFTIPLTEKRLDYAELVKTYGPRPASEESRE